MKTRTIEAQSVIRAMVETIVARHAPLKVILFGSFATGSASVQSDVDLLVVMPDGTQVKAATAAILRDLEDAPLAKDVIVTTPSELAQRGSIVGTIFRPALREGKVLYESS